MRHIANDSLEHSRIRLERDIDNNVPSPPSMSFEFAPRDDDDVSSVDFPRHNSHHPSFHSFEHASHLDSDFYSRHGDDDSIALDPDLGYTMSTAAHHASALTLSAGLRGRSAYNTTGRASPAGAEYDPERPLQAILDNKVADAISLFDATSRSKSQTQARASPSFDPVIVDSTAELDRFLRTGHDRPPLVYPYQSRSHSHPTSGTSDSETSHPRLTHALGRDFSPKRPRSTPVPTAEPSSRTPKPKTSFSHVNHAVQPPKPGPTALLAKQQPSRVGLMKDGRKVSDTTHRPPRRGLFPTGSRAPFSELGNKTTGVRLPDVTGLTSAVQSPAKNDAIYASMPALTRTSDILPALDALQRRLQALEQANGVSRRRVRELEHELEGCRAEVLAERTRIEEREQQVAHANAQRHGATTESRYRTVVAEKKALEALLDTLRSHLARLTSELATHKSLVEDLRTRGEHNARAEIQVLRTEVERLAGEVERLKAVVEEGLRERQRARQGEHNGEHADGAEHLQQLPTQLGIDLTYVTVPGRQMQSSREEQPNVDDTQAEPDQEEPEIADKHELAGEQEYCPGPDYEQDHGQHHDQDWQHQSPNDPHLQEVEQGREKDPMSEPQLLPNMYRTKRYINAIELSRVEAEMHERRSERSRSTTRQKSRDNDSGNGSSLTDAAPMPRAPNHRPRREVDTNEKENESPSPASSPRIAVRPADLPRTPFPQIRGSRMERLFFSAPEHNVRTCVVCHRRKRRGQHPREFKTSKNNDVEAIDDDDDIVRTYLRKRAQRSKAPFVHNNGDDDGDRPPAQTVLARVVRELEDDFSHYKAIYLELAEQYGVMDAVSNVAKRNVLADHLRDVIDTLEQKGDQIASLYDLLTFQDKPLPRNQQNQQKCAIFA